jgi:O-antigen ligase
MEIAHSSVRKSLIERGIITIILFLAISVSLPIAWISLGKILLISIGLLFIAATYLLKTTTPRFFTAGMLPTSKVALICVVVFAFSSLHTLVDFSFALHAFLKHSKILIFPLLIYFIRDRSTALLALTFFLTSQCVLITCSWLLYLGIEFPWSAGTVGKGVVFSSYIDQSIMFSIDAALLWHLRTSSYIPKRISICFAFAALGSVFFLLEGRTGYLTGLAVLGLAAMWTVQKRLRLITLVVTPLLVVSFLFIFSPQINTRITQAVGGTSDYSNKHDSTTSEGWRINAWARSIQAITTAPIMGSGVGSWSSAVKKIEGSKGDSIFGNSNSSNPHQEFLLWGVELGVVGIILLCAFLIAAAREALKFPVSIARACWSTLAVVTIACLFNSALYDDLLGDYLFVALGLTMALGVTSAKRLDEN